VSRVLVVEDDDALARSLHDYLGREGFAVQLAGTLALGRRALVEFRPDVLVLDWMLPDGQAIDWLKELRRKNDPIRVLMLTARAEVVDRIVGLETGANDYLTKPFEPRELVARIRVQARELTRLEPATMQLAARGIRLDLTTREVTAQSVPVQLTKMEFDLLRVFLENPNKVFSREELLNLVWGFETFPTTRTVDTHILQLRQKLDADAFETVRGIGYRFRAEGLTSS
jgi:DNA-binding response OmpR family regulator